MNTTFESILHPIYKSHIEIEGLENVTLDIEPLGKETSVEILTLQTNTDNPLSMILFEDNGIMYSIPSALENRGLLIEHGYLLTVSEKNEPKPCEICENDQTYGRGVVTYHTGETTKSLLKPVWIGIDCLTHLDKSLEDISIDLNSLAVSEII